MTVIFSKKCELAIQAVLYLSIKPTNVNFSARDISKDLNVPKEFVSKVLQILTHTGIVASQKGKAGGFSLAKKTSEITLFDIVQAIDGSEIFNKCVLGFHGCDPANPCPVHNVWGPIREEIKKMLILKTLEDLETFTQKKIGNIKKLFNK